METVVKELVDLWRTESKVIKKNLIQSAYEELGVPKFLIRMVVNLLDVVIKHNLEENSQKLIKKAEKYPSFGRVLSGFLDKINNKKVIKLTHFKAEEFMTALEELETNIIQGISWNPVLTIGKKAEDIDDEIKQLVAYNRYHTYVGREKSKQILQTFLDQDTPFSWMGMIGGAGHGKTRFAHEVASIAQEKYWRAGFLLKASLQNLEQLQNWQPLVPTLIFIDYAKDHTEKVEHLLSTLSSQQWNEGVLVRLVLIDRYSFKIKVDNQTQGQIDDMRFTEFEGIVESDNLVLSVLSESESDNLVLSVLSEQEIRALISQFNGVDVNKIIQEIEDKNYQAYPLYILLLCLQADKGEQVDLETILEHFLKRQGKLPWDTDGNTNAISVSKAIQIATLFGEFNQADFKTIGVDIEKSQSVMQSAERITEGIKDTLKPLEPDLLGEYFVLAFMQFLKDYGENLNPALFNKDLNYYKACIKRCHDDFPEKIKELYSCLVGPLLNTDLKQEINDYLEPNNVEKLFDEHLIAILTKDIDKARTVFAQLQTLAKDHPNNQEMQLELAKAAVNWLSGLNKNPADFKEARKVFEQLTTLAKDHPNNQEMQLALAKAAVNWLSGLNKNPADFKEARKVFEQSTTLAKDHPKNQEMQLELAKGAFNWLNGLRKNPANFKEARTVFAQLQTLAKTNPDNNDIQLTLAKGAFNWFDGLNKNPDEKYTPDRKQALTASITALERLEQQVVYFEPPFLQELLGVLEVLEQIKSLAEPVQKIRQAIKLHSLKKS